MWLVLDEYSIGMGAIGLAMIVVASCAAPPPITACPTPVPYTAEMQARAADELDALPADAALREMIADYIREREQLRVCAKP